MGSNERISERLSTFLKEIAETTHEIDLDDINLFTYYSTAEQRKRLRQLDRLIQQASFANDDDKITECIDEVVSIVLDTIDIDPPNEDHSMDFDDEESSFYLGGGKGW